MPLGLPDAGARSVERVERHLYSGDRAATFARIAAALLPTLSATPAVSPLLQAAGHDGRLLRPDLDEGR